IIILSEKLPASTALDWGLVDQLSEPGASLQDALALAHRAASMPPVQARMIKQSINANAHALDRAISHSDFDQFMLATGSGDYAEGVKSFFEKRPPNYTGA
ncbi:MAG: enoyl-CoA hydratase/isomerase family protein, partial [Burkholderiales bacterium]